MKTYRWYLKISFKQKIWLFSTVVLMLAIVIAGILLKPSPRTEQSLDFSVEMSIKQIAPKLGVTRKELARQLKLPLDVSKRKPLKIQGVTQEELQHVVRHLLHHRDSNLKYYVYTALVIWGLVFMIRLGRPDGSGVKNRSDWYPRAMYNNCLFLSVIVAGFLLGKSPNPMEGIVKVFKSMVGLYTDPQAKVAAFVFFLILAVVGNKMICGWACPFGAIQELVYSVPVLKNIKKFKLPFIVTNSIRAALFFMMLLFLFGSIGGRRGTVLYHYINPFNLFNLDFETFSILLTVIITVLVSFFIYRPFCQIICPFGLVSWIAERFSISRIRVEENKCTECGACIKACPSNAAKGYVYSRSFPADCFSCARCLNVCPVDAIEYTFFYKKSISGLSNAIKPKSKAPI